MSKTNLAIVLCLIWLFVQSAIIEPNDFKITHYSVEDNQLQGIRIAFLTDFHFKKRDYKKLNKIAQMTAQQTPDLIFLGGDYTNSSNPRNLMNMYIFATKLQQVNAPIYAVLGDADQKCDPQKIKTELQSNGIRVLEDQNVRIIKKRRYIDIIGLVDKTTRNPNTAIAFRRTSTPRIVISHNPDVYYNIMDETNLILAGHTHGGQFILPFSPPLFVGSKFGAEFASGLISKTQNKMIISKGLGMSGLPLRLNCKPEIVIVDFIKSSKK